jgi:hypothetical protein
MVRRKGTPLPRNGKHALEGRAVASRGRHAVVAVAGRGGRPYTTRRSPFVSTGTDRVQTEPRIQADSSAAPRGRLSQ